MPWVWLVCNSQSLLTTVCQVITKCFLSVDCDPHTSYEVRKYYAETRKSQHSGVNLVHLDSKVVQSHPKTCAVNLYINLLLQTCLLPVPQVSSSSSLEASSFSPIGCADPPPPAGETLCSSQG